MFRYDRPNELLMEYRTGHAARQRLQVFAGAVILSGAKDLW
jgi:hypothetical protein